MKKIHKFVTSLANGSERALCVLNGVLGDTLAENKVGLALRMALFDGRGPITLTRQALRRKLGTDAGKICILAHGSCASEKGWEYKKQRGLNYGTFLQKDFGYTPFFLRYNSGLHISTNGKHLSDLLEKFTARYPQAVNEIVLVGHSMGGLVFRSACFYGEKENRNWVRHVTKIFYLGSPHLGTHLEKLGKLTTTVLNCIPNPVTKMIVSLGDLRSAGVKDLRHGYLTDEDWKGKNADSLFYWPANNTPLLKHADHYLICGTLSRVAESRMGRLFGDGLVHPASGTGRGWAKNRAIPFLDDNCKVFAGISHNELQRNARVYKQIHEWCRA